MKLAGQVVAGEVVEFEEGSPVTVLTVGENWWKGAYADPHPALLGKYGKSLVFDCSFDGGAEVNTMYVRRERSPISGPGVVR